MSLEIAISTDTNMLVSSIIVYEASMSDCSEFKDSHNFRCSDPSCNIELTLVNFGKSNRIQKPRFASSHPKSIKHSQTCQATSTNEEVQINHLLSLEPNLSRKEALALTKNSTEFINIVERHINKKSNSSLVPQNQSQKQNSGTNSDTRLSKIQSETFHSTSISSLGHVFLQYTLDKNRQFNSINWPSYNSKNIKLDFSNDLVIKHPFKINAIVKDMSNEQYILNDTKIFIGKSWINFNEDVNGIT